MKIVVYPHDLAMGGSQLNAVEIAAAVQRLGHPTVVVGRPGTLVGRMQDLGLEFLETPTPSKRPSRRVAGFLRKLVRKRDIDIVHGYEWPPTLEAVWATIGERARPVSTVMSMGVAPFIPRTVPLLVGTEQIEAAERGFGRSQVGLLEPPVDLASHDLSNDYGATAFRAAYGIDRQELLVVVVSRLAQQLKLEGILTAIDAVGGLRERYGMRLCVVGDGPAADLVKSHAASANARFGEGTVVLTGELRDPRAAYESADITLGMGGSALRAMAFEKPLVVQGERGFWRTLDPQSAPDFFWTGWYGIGEGQRFGPAALTEQLAALAGDDDRRRELGRFGRQLVEQRYSLEHAARTQLEFYQQAISAEVSGAKSTAENATAFARYVRYYGAKRIRRARGSEQTDDFNATSVMPREQSERTPQPHA